LEENPTYKTLKNLSEGLYKDKGSKFIAYALCCRTETDAKHHLSLWRKEHHQARHICWAYRFGYGEQQKTRVNDDNEPSNSAGQPILRQIRAFDLTNILVAVVRYFGGAKLGISGLTLAYKEATLDALRNAEIIAVPILNQLKIECTYEQLPKVMNYLKINQLEIAQQDFNLLCSLTVSLPPVRLAYTKQNLQLLGVNTLQLDIDN